MDFRWILTTIQLRRINKVIVKSNVDDDEFAKFGEMGVVTSSSIAITLSASLQDDSVSENVEPNLTRLKPLELSALLTWMRLSELHSSVQIHIVVKQEMIYDYLMGIEGRKRFANNIYTYVCV